MMRVLKEPLPDHSSGMRMVYPGPLRVLGVENQRGRPVLYFESDERLPRVSRVIHVLRTGEVIRGGEYVGTVMLDSGDYVLHVYAEPPEGYPALSPG